MPLFEFYCESCGRVMERYTPSYTIDVIACDKCNNDASRVDKVYPSMINFQGSGFHSTDYK